YYPAFSGTNWTTYVISNAITPASGGGDVAGGGGTSGGSGGPPAPHDAMLATSETTSIDTVDLSEQLDAGDSVVPPSPWIPESLPNGAILKASGTYVPLAPPPCYQSNRSASQFASPDDGSDDGSSGASDPVFYEVVRDGVHCVGLTNGMVLSGTVTIPLEIAAPSDDPISGAVLQVDGNPAPGGAALQGFNNLWTFTWDTTTIPNGIHQVAAAVIFGEDATDVEMTNSLTVAITNVL